MKWSQIRKYSIWLVGNWWGPVITNSGLIHLFMQHCTLSQAHAYSRPSQVSSMPKEGRKKHARVRLTLTQNDEHAVRKWGGWRRGGGVHNLPTGRGTSMQSWIWAVSVLQHGILSSSRCLMRILGVQRHHAERVGKAPSPEFSRAARQREASGAGGGWWGFGGVSHVRRNMSRMEFKKKSENYLREHAQ